MNIAFLETLCRVVERGSFSAAARELRISQPAVSMQIASLEEYFGAKLLYRTGRSVALTPAGKHVYALAQQVTRHIDATKRLVSNELNEVKGELRLMASSTPGEYLLPQVLAEFMLKYPQVFVQVEVGNSHKALDRLLSSDIHMAIIGREVRNEPVSALKVAADEIVLIAPPTRPLASEIAPEELLTLPLIRRLPGSGTRDTVESALAEIGLEAADLRSVCELGSTAAVVEAVEHGIGAAFVSRLAAEKSIALGSTRLVTLRGVSMKRDLYLVAREGGMRTVAENALWQFIQENWNNERRL